MTEQLIRFQTLIRSMPQRTRVTKLLQTLRHRVALQFLRVYELLRKCRAITLSGGFTTGSEYLCLDEWTSIFVPREDTNVHFSKSSER